MTVLALQKLPKDDVPPKEIWGHGEKLIEWLERVERKQSKPDEEEIEEPPEGHELVRNELVEELIGKVKNRGE
jgi:hypothetical protein